MVEKSVLKFLSQGPKAWNKRISREKDALFESKADFLGLTLENADLHGQSFHNFDFEFVKLTNANLRSCDLSDCNLSSSDLSAALLSRAKLESIKFYETDLLGVNLDESELIDCVFADAALADASLQSADIVVTRFLHANLTRANFRGTTLSAVEFDQSDLSGADFTKVKMDACAFLNLDLRNVKGLSDVIHHGPSSIGIDTLFRSAGKIPQKFLKGCGVPAQFAAQMPTLAKRNVRKQFYSCFISHSSKDKTFCELLYKSLKGVGLRIWYFSEEAKWGRELWSEIDTAVRSYDKLIVVCSKSSLMSQPVLREIERALEREDKEGKEILFPIRLDDYVFDEWKHARRTDLTNKVIGDFVNWRNTPLFRSSLKKLVVNLESESAKLTQN